MRRLAGVLIMTSVACSSAFLVGPLPVSPRKALRATRIDVCMSDNPPPPKESINSPLLRVRVALGNVASATLAASLLAVLVVLFGPDPALLTRYIPVPAQPTAESIEVRKAEAQAKAERAAARAEQRAEEEVKRAAARAERRAAAEDAKAVAQAEKRAALEAAQGAATAERVQQMSQSDELRARSAVKGRPSLTAETESLPSKAKAQPTMGPGKRRSPSYMSYEEAAAQEAAMKKAEAKAAK